jgi:hypothetical protein
MTSLKKLLFISLLIVNWGCAHKTELSNTIPQKRVDECIKNKDPITCNEIGSELSRSYNEAERKTALEFFNRGCKLNYAKSCRHLADEYSYNYHDYKKASIYYRRSCEELKDAESCYYHAHNFRRMGEDKKFVSYLEKGCEMKEKFACYDLGRNLMEQNKRKEAINIFHRSCNLGYQKACERAEALDY